MLRSTISERSTRAVNQERTEGITGNECVRACTQHNTAGDQTQHRASSQEPYGVTKDLPKAKGEGDES